MILMFCIRFVEYLILINTNWRTKTKITIFSFIEESSFIYFKWKNMSNKYMWAEVVYYTYFSSIFLTKIPFSSYFTASHRRTITYKFSGGQNLLILPTILNTEMKIKVHVECAISALKINPVAPSNKPCCNIFRNNMACILKWRHLSLMLL